MAGSPRRTPYDNNLLMELGFWWAQHGYVYVAQDVRGRYDSEGDFVPWDNETNDGYDTLEWIGQQPWCDGNVGMTGAILRRAGAVAGGHSPGIRC